MTQIVNDGLGMMQSAGKKVLGGVGAVATGIRDEAGTLTHGIREHIDIDPLHHEPAAHKRKPPAGKTLAIETTASVAGALAAFFISRLVRTRLDRYGK